MSQQQPEPQNGPERDEQPGNEQEGQNGSAGPAEGQENGPAGQQPEGDTFPRSYVEKIRRENQNYRDRAKKGETAFLRLTESSMREATSGILVDPTDLPYDEHTMSDDEGFPDPEKIKEAASELVSRKPHLGSRRPRGDVGQGQHGKEDDFSLGALLRQNAG